MRCHFCPAEDARINGCHWTGTEYIRVEVCDPCYDSGSLASAPKRPRRKRTAQPLPATDWNYLVAFTKARQR